MQAKKKNPLEKQFNVRVTAEQHSDLRRYAFERNMSICEFVREYLEVHKIISPTVDKIS